MQTKAGLSVSFGWQFMKMWGQAGVDDPASTSSYSGCHAEETSHMSLTPCNSVMAR